jgi:hypothetical protein
MELSSGIHCLAISFFFNKLLTRIGCHVIRVQQIGWQREVLKFEECVNSFGISSYFCLTKHLLVVVVNTTLDVLDVDGHNSFVPLKRTTWVRYSKNLCPLYEMC